MSAPVLRPSLRAKRSNPSCRQERMDCFAEFILGRAFARPVGSTHLRARSVRRPGCPAIQFGLNREADGYVSGAVEHLKNMVAQQTTEFAPGPLFGNQFKAAVAGMAVGTGDVGFLHRINMRQRQNRSSPVPLPPLASALVQRGKAQQRRSRISD